MVFTLFCVCRVDNLADNQIVIRKKKSQHTHIHVYMYVQTEEGLFVLIWKTVSWTSDNESRVGSLGKRRLVTPISEDTLLDGFGSKMRRYCLKLFQRMRLLPPVFLSSLNPTFSSFISIGFFSLKKGLRVFFLSLKT